MQTSKISALVTGGSGGIGAEICQRLARDGYHVYVHANTALDKAQAVVESIQSQGGSAQALAFDVTNAEAVAQVRGGPTTLDLAQRSPRAGVGRRQHRLGSWWNRVLRCRGGGVHHGHCAEVDRRAARLGGPEGMAIHHVGGTQRREPVDIAGRLHRRGNPIQ